MPNITDTEFEYFATRSGLTGSRPLHDHKYAFLKKQTGLSSSLPEMEATWLRMQGANGVQVQELYNALGGRETFYATGGTVLQNVDNFTTAAAAPMSTPRNGEPGPFKIAIYDVPTTKVSISGGNLVLNGGTSNWGDVAFNTVSSLARKVGRTCSQRVKFTTNFQNIMFGWTTSSGSDFNGYGNIGFTAGAGTNLAARYTNAVTSPEIYTLALDSYYTMATILRATGRHLVLKDGNNWVLVWSDTESTDNTFYAGATLHNATTITSFDYQKLVDLPTPWNNEFDVATDRKAGAVSEGTSFTTSGQYNLTDGNFNMNFVVTTLPAAGNMKLRFRQQDANNYWSIWIGAGGTIALYETVAGVDTQRATAGGVLANGNRVFVSAVGSTIKCYTSNTIRFTYSSASNFSTRTTGELNALATGGAISDIVVWPRTLTGRASAVLNVVGS